MYFNLRFSLCLLLIDQGGSEGPCFEYIDDIKCETKPRIMRENATSRILNGTQYTEIIIC